MIIIWLSCFQLINSLSQNGAAHIPNYLGLGYDIIKGNPLTDKIDPGFKAPIFQFTYKQNSTTDDGKYSIPDNVYSSQSTSCSLNSQVNQFSGTQSYQNELKTKVSVSASGSYLIVSASFSGSVQFQKLSNMTTIKQNYISHATGECEAYKLTIPHFSKIISLNADFIEGVNQAYKNNNWEQFVNFFGFYFAQSVIFGGRVVQQHSYSNQSMSLFNSMHLDIKMAAKVQFCLFFHAQTSSQIEKYQNETKVINKYVEQQTEVYIGGHPPSSGKWNDWQALVKDNLAPINYQLQPLSNLFSRIDNLDSEKATASFINFTNNYCKNHTCRPITPDRPLPKPTVVTYQKGPQQKIINLSNKFDTVNMNYTAGMRIKKVLLGYRGDFESFQLILGNGLIQKQSNYIGSLPLSHTYTVPDGDQIKCIQIGIRNDRNYMKIDSMQFITVNGVTSQQYKSSIALQSYRMLCKPSDLHHIIGIYGTNMQGQINSFGLDYIVERYSQENKIQ